MVVGRILLSTTLPDLTLGHAGGGPYNIRLTPFGGDDAGPVTEAIVMFVARPKGRRWHPSLRLHLSKP